MTWQLTGEKSQICSYPTRIWHWLGVTPLYSHKDRSFIRYFGQGSSLLWTPTWRPSVGPMQLPMRQEGNWLVCASVCVTCSYWNSLHLRLFCCPFSTLDYTVPLGFSSATCRERESLVVTSPVSFLYPFDSVRVLRKEQWKVADVVNVFLAETCYYCYCLISTVYWSMLAHFLSC